jgi:hypothetical protein
MYPLFSLLAWIEPVSRAGKAARTAAPATGGWTATHTWIASGIGLLCVAIVFVTLMALLALALRKRAGTQPGLSVTQTPDQAAFVPRLRRGPSLITDGDRLVQEDLDRDDTMARLKSERKRWLDSIGFRHAAEAEAED